MAEVVVFGVVAADVILRVQRIPAPGDHVNAEAPGWRIGGSSANVACRLSAAGHQVRLVGPVGRDAMGDNLLAELERRGVDIEHRPHRSLHGAAPLKPPPESADLYRVRKHTHVAGLINEYRLVA